MQARTIDEVIEQLNEVIRWAKDNNSRLGYFPALYRKVTVAVRQGIADGYFDDGKRMERLDVVFANRYLDAITAYRTGKPTTASWQVAFDASNDWSAIVLQHLLLGINAHINLDLGIAAALTAPGRTIESLRGDFDRINHILASLVNGVEQTLAKVWPMLKLLDWIAGKSDEAVINFSMNVARKEAWNAALSLAELDDSAAAVQIAAIDRGVSLFARSIQHPGPIVGSVTNLVRLGERGSVSDVIQLLERV
jgi:hypothetical protein